MGKSSPDLLYDKAPAGKGRPRKAIREGRQQCSICKWWKPLDAFGPSKVSYSGYETRCKRCNTTRTLKSHSKTIHMALYYLNYSHHNNKSYGRKAVRRRQLISESEVTLDLLKEMWAKQGGKCAVTGIPMTWAAAAGRVPTNVSLDRIDNSLGYSEDNIRLVCKMANHMKNSLSDQQMLEWCRLILNGPLVTQPQPQEN
jgi:hypothetical protein